MSDSNNTIKIVLTVDGAQLSAGLAQASAQVTNFGTTAKTSGGQINIVGASAAKAAANTTTAAESAAKVGAAATAAGKEGAEAMDLFSGATTRAKTELIVLLHELSQGQTRRFGGSLLVLAEQLNISGALFSILGLGAIAATAAIGGFLYEVVKGISQSREFNDQIRLTGDYAGVTEVQFNGMIKAVAAATDGSLSKSREAMLAVISTGRFTSESAEQVSRAIVNIADITGEKTGEVAKQLANTGGDVAKWAANLNSSFNFLNASQFQYIENLDSSGKSQQAVAETMRLLNLQLESQKQPVGFLSRAWHAFTAELSGAADAIQNIGRDTPGTIDRLKVMIDRTMNLGRGTPGAAFAIAFSDPQAERNAAEAAAKKRSQDAQDNQAAIAAQQATKDLTASIDKQTASVKQQVATFNQGAEALARYQKAQAMADAFLIKDPTARQGRVDAINSQYAPLIDASRELDNQKAALELQKQQAAERKQDLLAQMALEENERKLIQDAQARMAVAQVELASGTKLTQAEKERVELQSRLVPLQYQSADAALHALDSIEKQVSAQEKAQQAIENFIRQGENQLESRSQVTRSINQSTRDNNPNGLFAVPKSNASVIQQQIAEENALYAKKVANLKAANDRILGGSKEFQQAMEIAERQHVNRLAAIDEAANKNKLTAAEFASRALGNLASAAQSLGIEKSRHGFQIMKEINVAQAIANTATAVTNALAVPPYPVGLALAITAGIAGAAQIAAIQNQDFPGAASGRQYGGPVYPGALHQVGEGGRPELLQSGGKFYLLPGDNGGVVTPAANDAGSGGGSVSFQVNLYGAPGGDVQSTASMNGNQATLDIVLGAYRADMSKQLQNDGPLVKQFSQTFGLKRVGRG